MEEEIDLRQYVAILIKYRYWIIGLGVVAAVTAFVVSSFTPPAYKATALVTATQSRYELQFDPRFQNVPDSAIQSLLESQYRTYPTLAESDDLLNQVAEQVGWRSSDLRKAVRATTDASAPNLLTLTATGQNPEEVANIVNTWAQLFVEKANTLYGSRGELAQFDQQQEIVAQSLAEADVALTQFRQENGLGFDTGGGGSSSSGDGGSSDGGSGSSSSGGSLLEKRLNSRSDLLNRYELQLIELRQMQREVELLFAATTADTSPVLIAGLLAEMINTGVVETSQPYQIKMDTVDPAAALAAMTTALQSQATAIEAELESLQADVNALQSELATKQEQLEQLVRDRDVKAETYAVISRKVQEAQIGATNEGSSAGKVQIASRAAVPTDPLSSGRLRNTVVAGMLGLMVGVFGAFGVEWWREGSG